MPQGILAAVLGTAYKLALSLAVVAALWAGDGPSSKSTPASAAALPVAFLYHEQVADPV